MGRRIAGGAVGGKASEAVAEIARAPLKNGIDVIQD
jgi:hypothetical protein